MKPIHLLFILLILSLSCISNKTSPKHKQLSKECFLKIDSVAQVMKHIRFGVYSPQWDSFSIEQYKGLSILDLAKLDLPLTEEELLVYEFETFVEKLAKDDACRCEFTKEVVINQIGVPFQETYRGELMYKFNYGSNCPCKNCPTVSSIFDGCTALVFAFDNKGCLIGIFKQI